MTFIDNLSDDNGLLHPGTNAWDLRGSTATVPAHTLMTDREFNEHFNAYDRTPVELMVSNDESKEPQTSAVPMDELLASADQYTDIAQAGRYELNMANIADGESLTVNTLSAKQMTRLIDLIQAGDGMHDVDEQPAENSESFDAFLEDSMDASVRSEDVAEGVIELVPLTPTSDTSDKPMRVSELNLTPNSNDASELNLTPGSNDSSWIGKGASILRTPTL